jgi:hypothetical protein
MNIYLLTQDANREYDTYDACVVAAKNQESARRIRPDHRKSQRLVFKKSVEIIKTEC